LNFPAAIAASALDFSELGIALGDGLGPSRNGVCGDLAGLADWTDDDGTLMEALNFPAAIATVALDFSDDCDFEFDLGDGLGPRRNGVCGDLAGLALDDDDDDDGTLMEALNFPAAIATVALDFSDDCDFEFDLGD
jgi:hypothetical protein